MPSSLIQDLAPDALQRDAFVRSLKQHIQALAELEEASLPTPRVISVDAAWGNGKSWVARTLATELMGAEAQHPVAFIDAFRHDHHAEAFPVVASAIMEAIKPRNAARKKWLNAAGSVLAATTPVLVKAASNTALGLAGLDQGLSEELKAAKDKAIEGVGQFSEKQVEALFKKFTATQAVQDKFTAALSELTGQLAQPFVVVIDELDRCKPSFALEVLEQIKHLFSAKNTVFVLFWNAGAIHESIRHTYGRETAAEAYLAKFIALALPLPDPSPAGVRGFGRFSHFLVHEASRLGMKAGSDVLDVVSEVAEGLDLTLRDVQKVLGLLRTALADPRSRSVSWPEYVYAASLRTVSEQRYRAVRLAIPREDRDVLHREAARLKASAGHLARCEYLWAVLRFLADKRRFVQMQSASYSPGDLSEEDRKTLEICGHRNGAHQSQWMDGAMQFLEEQLTQRR